MNPLLYAQVNQQWVQRFNGSQNSFDIVKKLLLDANGNVYVYGTTNETAHGTDMIIIKYNPAGNIVWAYKFNGNTFEKFRP